MYEKFYNLTKEPFHITPDPRFLYLSGRHKQALSSLIYGIEKRKGFVAITGGVGVGKTIIIRAYLEKATGAGLKLIYLFHANASLFPKLSAPVWNIAFMDLTAIDEFLKSIPNWATIGVRVDYLARTVGSKQQRLTSKRCLRY